jgi:aminoglycoside phosphotransferase (APT) family kinase protein
MDFSALNNHQDMLPPGTPDVARLREDAIQLLTQIDEREHLHTQKVFPLPAGMWNALYRLEPSGVVAKLSFMENQFEVDFLRQAHALHLPVPQVFACGKLDHTPLPNATYFLMSYLDNVANAWPLTHVDPRMQPDALIQLGHDLGQTLATLHSVHLGYITRFGTRVDTWQATITDGFSPDWDNPAPNALFDAELSAILKHSLQATNYLSFRDGTLTHCDLNLSNVLVDTTTHQLRAIIDPGGYAGMPMFDLAYASMPWDYGWDFYHAMRNSYQQHADKFDPAQFYTSILIVAYRHDRFHTPAIRESILRNIVPHLPV